MRIKLRSKIGKGIITQEHLSDESENITKEATARALDYTVSEQRPVTEILSMITDFRISQKCVLFTDYLVFFENGYDP
jgi:hypothetical protein